jgi:chromosomal replication initiation ATPase DnaA
MSNVMMSYVKPKDLEIANAIVRATCEVFEISEEALRSDNRATIANMRQMVYFLMKKYTDMKDYNIGARMGKSSRHAISFGVEKIETHKRIYRQTMDELCMIVERANTFEKKYYWHLHKLD